jgi:hypothetical protein
MPKDTLSPQGAHDLSIKLQQFWRARGLEIRVQAVRIKMRTNSVPSNLWQLRSNLCFDAHGNAYVKEKS